MELGSKTIAVKMTGATHI